MMKGLFALALVGACGLALASALIAHSGLPTAALVRALCMLLVWLLIDSLVVARDAQEAEAEVAALRKAELAALARVDVLRAQLLAERAAHAAAMADACAAHAAAMAEAHAAALTFERQRTLLLPWMSPPPSPSPLLSCCSSCCDNNNNNSSGGGGDIPPLTDVHRP
jgi:hypothetical protein